MSKIVPIGGEHRSAKSLLAEVMNDPELERCVVVTLGPGDRVGWAFYMMSSEQLTYAAAILNRVALEDDV